MSLRSWIAGFICLVLGMYSTYAVGREPIVEPILGPAESIGTLLLFADIEEAPTRDLQASIVLGTAEPIGQLLAFFMQSDLDSIEAVVFESAPQLGRPELLASLIPDELDILIEKPIAVGPNHNQTRLREASRLLQASGLTEEAEDVLKFISKNDQGHLERLNKKAAEAESVEVVVTVKFIELKDELPATTTVRNAAVFWKQIDELKLAGAAKIPSSATLRTRVGKTCQVHNEVVLQADAKTSLEYGTTIQVLPKMIRGNRVQLELCASSGEIDPTVGLAGIPGIRRRRIQCEGEFESGEVHLLAGIVISTDLGGDNGSTTRFVVAISTEIVSPTIVSESPMN